MQLDKWTKLFTNLRWIAIAFGIGLLVYGATLYAWIDVELNAPELIQVRHEIDEKDKEKREHEAEQRFIQERALDNIEVTQEEIRQFIYDMSKARYDLYESMKEQDGTSSGCCDGTTLDRGHD